MAVVVMTVVIVMVRVVVVVLLAARRRGVHDHSARGNGVVLARSARVAARALHDHDRRLAPDNGLGVLGDWLRWLHHDRLTVRSRVRHFLIVVINLLGHLRLDHCWLAYPCSLRVCLLL